MAMCVFSYSFSFVCGITRREMHLTMSLFNSPKLIYSFDWSPNELMRVLKIWILNLVGFYIQLNSRSQLTSQHKAGYLCPKK